jgi:acetyltransferase-like isoleucine patch superfamily enzyme
MIGVRRWLSDVVAFCQRQRLRRAGVNIGSMTSVAPGVAIRNGSGGRITIGSRCEISPGVIISSYGGTIVIGDDVFIGPYCVLYGHGGLVIGSKTLIAAHTVVIPANHNFDRIGEPIACQSESRIGIQIGEDCWIGAGARILDGVVVGNGSVVGAGAVVTRSIPGLAIAVGVPARVVRTRGSTSG